MRLDILPGRSTFSFAVHKLGDGLGLSLINAKCVHGRLEAAMEISSPHEALLVHLTTAIRPRGCHALMVRGRAAHANILLPAAEQQARSKVSTPTLPQHVRREPCRWL
eukprot:scaffold290972_cov39-Tisochrysis_lutea.AAC.1